MKVIADLRQCLLMALLLLGALLASMRLGFAQEQPKAPERERPGDLLIMRALPRAELYTELSRQVGVKPDEVKKQIIALEDTGFLLRDAMVLLFLARARAVQLIEDGKFKKGQAGEALRASVAYLVALIEKQGVTWPELVDKADVGLNFRDLRAKADVVMSLASPPRPGVTTRKVEKVRVEPIPPEKRQARKEKRQPDPVPEDHLPREEVLKNMAKEFEVGREKVEALLVQLEKGMPMREGIMLLVVASAVTDKNIREGKYSREKREEAFEEAVKTILPSVEKGEGWGDLGQRLGVPLSGANVNHRVNALMGQK